MKTTDAMQQLDYQTAIDELRRSLDIWPENYAADVRLGWIYATCPDEAFQDGEKALMHAKRALDTRSCEDKHREWLSINGLAVMAAAEARVGDFEAAVRTQEMAIDAVANSSSKVRDTLLRRYRSILEVYEARMPLTTPHTSPGYMDVPGSDIVLSKRGEDAFRNGDYQAAIRAFKELAPRQASEEMRLAWLYATCPDSKWRNPREVVVHATRALKKNREHKNQDYMARHEWAALATLAAAYAETGDFEKAVQTQEESLRATSNAVRRSRDRLRRVAAALLELYKAGKPMRSNVLCPSELKEESVKRLLKNKE